MQKIVKFVEEESLKNFLNILIIKRLEMVAFMQVNIEVQDIVFVI